MPTITLEPAQNFRQEMVLKFVIKIAFTAQMPPPSLQQPVVSNFQLLITVNRALLIPPDTFHRLYMLLRAYFCLGTEVAGSVIISATKELWRGRRCRTSFRPEPSRRCLQSSGGCLLRGSLKFSSFCSGAVQRQSYPPSLPSTHS